MSEEKDLDIDKFDDDDDLDNDKDDDLDDDLSKDLMDDDDDDKARMDLIRSLTSFDKDIKEMVSGWLGYEWDEEKQTFSQSKAIIPVCNKHCAAWCTNYLRTYLRQTNSLINPTEKDYYEIMQDATNLVWGTFGTEHKVFGFETTSDINKVATQLLHSIRLLLTSTRHGGIKSLIKDTHQQQEKIEENKKPTNIQRLAANLFGMGGNR